MENPLFNLLLNVVGAENISNKKFELLCYSRDSGSSFPRLPEYVIIPRTTEQVSDVLRIAGRYNKPVMLRGAGSSVCGAPIPIEGGIVVDMTAMRKIVEIDEDSMTVTVQAGITWTEMLHELGKRGLETGLEGPWSAPSATVGGSIAVNAICIGAAKHGGIGEEIIGMKVVLPNGDVLKTGSGANPACAMVERYCNGADLAGLFIGSHGAFGVITEATLKLYPVHEADENLAFAFDDVESLSKAIQSLVKNRIPYDARTFVYPVPEQMGDKTGIVIWLRGNEEEVQRLTNLARTLMVKNGGREVHGFAQTYYAERFTTRVKAFGAAGPGWLEVAGFVPVSYYPRVTRVVMDYFAKRASEMKNLEIKWSLGGLLMQRSINVPVALFCNEQNKEAWLKMHEYLQQVAGLMYSVGVSPYWIGLLSPYIMWKLGSAYTLFRIIKQTLDPKNILNPNVL